MYNLFVLPIGIFLVRVLRYKSVRTDTTSVKEMEVEWSENVIILININEQLLS